MTNSKFEKAVSFIFLAIPAVVLYLFSIAWIVQILDTEKIRYDHLILSISMMVGSLIFILIGTGNLKKWKYIFVFLSIFISPLILYILEISCIARGTLLGDVIITFGIPAFVVAWIVRNHYQKKYQGRCV